MAAVIRNGRTIARYRYDYRGLRRQKSTEDRTTGFTCDPSSHLISQQTREGRDEGQRDYLWTDTAPIARIDSPLGQAKVHKDWLPQALMGFLHRHEREEHGHATPLYYFHTDAMGTPKLATNEKQQVVWRWNDDAFGATVAAEQNRHGYRDHDRDHGSHGIEVNLRYPGQYYDSETGLFYNWNRYYNPNTGRYSRSDPIGLSGGVNTYSYVKSAPFAYSDFSGLVPNPAEVACVAGPNPACIGGLVTDAVTTIGGMAIVVYNKMHDADLQKQIEYEANKAEYHNRCDEPEPPNFLSPCDRAMWQLKKAQECKALRQTMTNRWFNGVEDAEHARHMAQIDRQIQKAERAVKQNCECKE